VEPITIVRFERGTLVIDERVDGVPGVLWDARTQTWRAAAHRLSSLRKELTSRGKPFVDSSARWEVIRSETESLELRPYQKQALAAWSGFDRRGVVVLPTGAGKTRVAIAAIRATGLPSVVLCPTRALAETWVRELGRWTDGPIGLVGDGERRVERITVMTFESAYRLMDVFGERFGLLVVDEVHHFGTGARIEALEASPAIARMGLTATISPMDPVQLTRIEELVGPVVFETRLEELTGTHLAPVTVRRISVRLDTKPYRNFARSYFAAYPGADFESLTRALAASSSGRLVLSAYRRGIELASFPRAKRRLVARLLQTHRDDKSLVFTAYIENAYSLARENLIPVIGGQTPTAERREVLARFADGRYRAIASARVLNEGIDVPDARVAVIVAGTLGVREHVQRIGRVLRPSAGKEATVYELVTADTADERSARKRRHPHAA
jgi:superfamily II DNA or RNA helicase